MPDIAAGRRTAAKTSPGASAATHTFRRALRADLPMAVRGDGLYIVDAEGRRYLDASGGAAVSCLGHSDPEVRAAIVDQVERLAFAHTGFFTSQPAEALADLLAAGAPGDLNHVYFTSGGSEAVEAALKMARQYAIEIGAPERRHFIARRQSYHGATLGALAVGGHRERRAPYEPLLADVTHIAPCHAYRGRRENEDDQAYGRRVADELEAAIERLGTGSVLAFVAETVVGATLGAVAPVSGYLKRIREICDRHAILLILDEVMCGMGRTGTLHACAQEDVVPDLLCLAKGLGAGYQPIGAVLANDRVYRAFARGSGAFRHGHTYMGHPTACAAALAVQRAIAGRDLLANVRVQGEALDDALRACFAAHPHVGDIRGRGLFRAIELVADRASKAPFDPALKLHARIKAEAMTRGLICYPAGGTADGVRGDHVLLAPPFIATGSDIETIVERLDAAAAAALRGCGA